MAWNATVSFSESSPTWWEKLTKPQLSVKQRDNYMILRTFNEMSRSVVQARIGCNDPYMLSILPMAVVTGCWDEGQKGKTLAQSITSRSLSGSDIVHMALEYDYNRRPKMVKKPLFIRLK